MNERLLILPTLLACGCTTSFTNMTPTRALEPLDAEVSVRGQAVVHGSVIRKTIDGGQSAVDVVLDEDSNEPISEDQLRDFLDTGLAFFLFKPGANFELSARLGGPKLFEGMDFGLRYDFTTVKGDWKLQYFESPGGLAISSIVGVGKQTVPVPGVVEYLTLTEWSRTDFDFMLSLGWELPDILHLWLNPRVMLSTIKVEHKLPGYVLDRIPSDVQEQYDPNNYFGEELLVYYGATFGGMVGYKYVFVAAELTAMGLSFSPEVLGQERDFDSLVLSPSIGLVATW